MKLSCCDRSKWVWSLTKTRQDNNMIYHIGLVYYKNDTELSIPIEPSAVCDENQIG